MIHHLRALERTLGRFEPGLAARRLELLAKLARARMASAAAVARLHEALCYLRAYPDDGRVLERAERMLARFHERGDLRSFAGQLASSGVAGTEIREELYYPMATWLVSRFPDRVDVDWKTYASSKRLESCLPLMLPFAESPGLEELTYAMPEWCRRLKGPGETDAVFLVRRFQAIAADSFVREWIYDEVNLPMVLHPGPDTPARGREKLEDAAVHFQAGPLDTSRPALHEVLDEKPLAVRVVSRRRAERLIDMAREAMLLRSRDLDLFAWGDPRDVRLVEWGEGLQFAVIGARPERRQMLEAVYGFLTLKNGVPIGYVLNSALFGSAEIAYNVFETFRGGEAGRIYGRALATVRHLFGVDSFTVYPYQLGHENQEGLDSGAWWFYQKLGFRAKHAGVLELMEAELEKLRKRRGYRTPVSRLKQLAKENVYYHLGRKRDDVIGVMPLYGVGLAISAELASRAGADREAAQEACELDAARHLRVRSLAGWSAAEKLAWRRWAPLVATLPRLSRWSAAERRALVEVIRAKGGRRESEFVLRFDAHDRLRRAVRRLAHAQPWQDGKV
jgi:hypothetical protein